LPRDVVSSACPHDCASTCALEIERIDGVRIGVVRGAEDNAYTAGVVCAKVARYAERTHHPDRLTVPLRRAGPKGSGAFEPISWEAALDAVAGAFRDAAARHGPQAIWPYNYAGTMGLVQRDGIQRLRHVMRTSRQHSTICSTLLGAGWRAGVGVTRGVDPREIPESDLIVLWGCNPATTQVNLMHHVARARKERGAKLCVVDPYRTRTAEIADLHLDPRPGTDGALACAVMHVLLRDGLADRDYLAAYTDFSDAVEEHLAPRTPDWASEITGMAPGRIEDFAHLYGATKRSWMKLGYGFSRSRNGAANVHAASCLPAVTGAWRQRGGGATASLSGNFAINTTLIEGLDAIDRTTRALDMSRIGAILTGDPADLAGGPPVTVMLIQNTNPCVVAPDSGLVRQGFAREDLFVCVHEQFMTDTAHMADIVLPATTFVEHDDFYAAYGHTFLQLGPQLIPPVGEARSNHDVLCALAARLGLDHEGFRLSAWEIIDRTLKASGLGTADELRQKRWIDCAPSFAASHFLNGFATQDMRFHFAADWSRVGREHAAMPRLPDHMAAIDAADDRHPFRMVTGPSRSFLNSSFTETATSRAQAGRPTARIATADCDRLGIVAGARVRIGNDRGSLVLHAEPFDGLPPGVIVVESVWPNGAFEEGIGINLLTSADPGPPLGGAVFHDTAVWVRRESPHPSTSSG
jgi:anaerobic selenocysteine-containing dehydrogenase